MTEYTLAEDWVGAISRTIRTWIAQLVNSNNMQDLASDFPGRLPYVAHGLHDSDFLAFTWEESSHTSRVDTFGSMKEEIFYRAKYDSGRHSTYKEMMEDIFLSNYFSTKKLLIFTEVRNNSINLQFLANQVAEWFYQYALPGAEAANRARIQRAIPTPPAFDVGCIQDSCWVVENETTLSQGTAFFLEGVGFVTCAHVVLGDQDSIATDIKLFHPTQTSAEYSLKDFRLHRFLDLAVFQSDAKPEGSLVRSANDDFPILAHVAVCGYPNFRKGDSCFLSPGLVVAHRVVSGVRRFLTNAPIVAGMSGGPAISGSGEVMGILTHGAKSWQRLSRLKTIRSCRSQSSICWNSRLIYRR
ncbi:S1 family peptidase [Mesorhizobium sp. ORM8.1]